MQSKVAVTAKAVTPDEQSDSIVVSFGARWYQHLMARDFSAVIRKRIPKSKIYKWLYFHINSPISAICGRAKIETIFDATSKEAVSLAKQIYLSNDDILSYIGDCGSIGCYKLGTIQLCVQPIPIAKLMTRLIYHPPQSFFILSVQAKAIVDEFASFDTPKVSQPR